MSARREKGLCYNFDEPFTAGHRCQVTYMMMTEEEEATYMGRENFVEEKNDHSTVLEEVELSLNTISEEDGVTTMRLIGEYDKQKLHIILDFGSYLSFLQ